jgi:hypothetical protein
MALLLLVHIILASYPVLGRAVSLLAQGLLSKLETRHVAEAGVLVVARRPDAFRRRSRRNRSRGIVQLVRR